MCCSQQEVSIQRRHHLQFSAVLLYSGVLRHALGLTFITVGMFEIQNVRDVMSSVSDAELRAKRNIE